MELAWWPVMTDDELREIAQALGASVPEQVAVTILRGVEAMAGNQAAASVAAMVKVSVNPHNSMWNISRLKDLLPPWLEEHGHPVTSQAAGHPDPAQVANGNRIRSASSPVRQPGITQESGLVTSRCQKCNGTVLRFGTAAPWVHDDDNSEDHDPVPVSVTEQK